MSYILLSLPIAHDLAIQYYVSHVRMLIHVYTHAVHVPSFCLSVDPNRTNNYQKPLESLSLCSHPHLLMITCDIILPIYNIIYISLYTVATCTLAES